MDNIYFLDLVFSAKREIKSLPPFYGPRFGAWFRFACKSAELTFDEFCLGILPFRDGISPHIKKNDKIRVRLILNDLGCAVIPLFLNHLVSTTSDEAQFCANTLELVDVIDPITRKPPTLNDNRAELSIFSQEILTKELTVLSYLKYFTIDFISPLSLLLPPGFKRYDQPEIYKLCREDFFSKFENSLMHLTNNIRLIDKTEDTSVFHVPIVFSGELEWSNLRYNKDRQVPMGGLTGYIKIKTGIPDNAILSRLVYGQYTGIGKKSRFGLGFYKIRELDAVRDIILPKTDYLVQGREYQS